MKALINTAKLNRYTTVCTVIGYYDENTEYKERTLEDLPIKELPKRVSKNIYLNHDVTVQIAPKKEIRVFAKNMEEIEKFRFLCNEDNYIKGMFDSFSKHNGPYMNGDYIWTTVDIEEFIKKTSEF